MVAIFCMNPVNATQHFHIVATLFQHCYAVLGKKSSLRIVPCNITLKHDMFKSFKVEGKDLTSFTRHVVQSFGVDGWKRSKNASMDTEFSIRFWWGKKFILKCNDELISRLYAKLVVLSESSGL